MWHQACGSSNRGAKLCCICGDTMCNKFFGVIVAPRTWLMQSWCQVVLHMWCHQVQQVLGRDCGTKNVAQAIVVPSCVAYVVPSFIDRSWLQSWLQSWHQSPMWHHKCREKHVLVPKARCGNGPFLPVSNQQGLQRLTKYSQKVAAVFGA